MKQTRRRIMWLAGAVLGFCAVGRARTGLAAEPLDLAGLLTDPAAAAAVGAAYLESVGASVPDLATLRSAVWEALREDPVALPRGARPQARFRARVRQDFEAMRVVMVDGWMLSRVEAQVCAIAHLSAAV